MGELQVQTSIIQKENLEGNMAEQMVTEEELVAQIKKAVEDLSADCEEAANRGIAIEIQMASPENEFGVPYGAFKVSRAWKNLMPSGILRLGK